ncbi:ATP-grasp domain-containing protein [Winogradskyella aurantia]|uniref:Carbamoyl-phosphate-synthetase n=1 Tax=Winogradskyella aurantia TaxID=1915063 RepID=A0A265UX48_9FLAO|nr:carbamoyl-phosphate-synthetase [Winogradskyella aurantia]OZV69879.1 carbamoyl-phosphate-synthetase [Winogradskyella aurantia]
MLKKLIILGGNPETAVLVDTAKAMGVYTIVIDMSPDSPAKRHADKSYDLDVFKVDEVVKIALDNKVDGVLVGVADILVKPYKDICDRLNLPCYATEKAVEAFCSKDGFKRYCIKHHIQDIPGIYIDDISKATDSENIKLPVMIKPVDNGGGVGMKICRDESDLEDSIKTALKFSKKGVVLVERYMDCDDMAAYYTFRNGVPYLSAISDRFTTKKQGDSSPVCIGAIFPSKYTDAFVKTVHPQLCNLFKDLEVKNGVLNIQFFVENGEFYAYDPGFRLQGEAPHIPIAHINGFDHRKMLVNFALTGVFGSDDFADKNDYMFKGNIACTIWVLLKDGQIDVVEGLKEIKSDENVIFVLDRFKAGDVVEPKMLGTEKQVFSRIYVVGNTVATINNKIIQFKSLLKVKDTNNEDMILEWLKPFDTNNYSN